MVNLVFFGAFLPGPPGQFCAVDSRSKWWLSATTRDAHGFGDGLGTVELFKAMGKLGKAFMVDP